MERKVFLWFGRILLITAVFLSFFSLSALPVDAARSVRIAAEQNLPVASVDDRGEGEGFLMDIARHVAKQEGWVLTYISCELDTCLSMLKNGRIDLLAGVAISEERSKYADYTRNAAISSWGRIYTPAGKEVESYLLLEGRSVAVVKNDIHYIVLQDMLRRFGVRPVFKEVGNYEDVFRLVDAGRVDAGVVSRFFGLRYESKYSVIPTNLLFNPAELRFAAPKGGNGDLLAALDRHIDALKADEGSLYYRALKKWTGSLRKKAYPDWVGWTVLFVFVAACLVTIHNVALRLRVKSRTARLEQEAFERVRADEALRMERDRQLALTENAPFGMLMVARDGTYRYMNPKFTEMFGYTHSDVPDGRTWFKKAYPDPDCRHEVIAAWHKMLAGFGPGENMPYENRVICADGTEKIVNFKPVILGDGEILITLEDVTAKRVAENQLVKYRDHLEDLVVERTAELEIAREKAESADRLKSAFLAIMSHELRTPLNSIIGFTGLLIQGLAGPLNDEQRKQLGMVQQSSRHLLELINDVLDISKIEAGQLAIDSAPFDLRASINKVAGLVSPLAEKKGLALRLKISGEVGTFVGDKRRTEQIIINLLNNAIKFTEKGFVEVSCATRDSSIVVSVADTGIGIGQEDMEAIFQPFQQVDTGLSRRHEGTGLGLSITRKLVDMMGGEIVVRSTVGQGSTFTVMLPGRPKEEE